MHVKMIYDDRIESWDTKAGGLATLTHAALQVKHRTVDGHPATVLELWSNLRHEALMKDFSGNIIDTTNFEERGTPRQLAVVYAEIEESLQVMLDYLGETERLLRFDVDGETIYTNDLDFSVKDEPLAGAVVVDPEDVFDPNDFDPEMYDPPIDLPPD